VLSFCQMAFTTYGYRALAVSRETPTDRAPPYLMGQIQTIMMLFPMIYIKDWRIKGGYIVSLMAF